jgi:hypothetical protein
MKPKTTIAITTPAKNHNNQRQISLKLSQIFMIPPMMAAAIIFNRAVCQIFFPSNP